MVVDRNVSHDEGDLTLRAASSSQLERTRTLGVHTSMQKSPLVAVCNCFATWVGASIKRVIFSLGAP